jgi:hypothetical protein
MIHPNRFGWSGALAASALMVAACGSINGTTPAGSIARSGVIERIDTNFGTRVDPGTRPRPVI